MSLDTLISVRFQGYCLQIRMPLASQIVEIVEILKDNDFLPSDISNENLAFYKKNRQNVKGNDKVSSLIQKNQGNSSCELLIEIVAIREKAQNQEIAPNKFLSKVASHIKQGQIDTLLNARQNAKIDSSTAESLASIGQNFRDLKMQKLFYKQALNVIKNMIEKKSVYNQFQNKCNQYEDYSEQQYKNVANLCQKIFQLIKNQQKSSQDIINFKQKIQSLEKEKKNLKKQKQDLATENNKKIKQLQKTISKKNTQNSVMSTELTDLKIKNDQIKVEVQNQKSKVQAIKKSYQDQLEKSSKLRKQLENSLKNQKNKIQSLTNQLLQKQRQIEQKNNQILKIKSQNIDQDISQYITQISKLKTNPNSSKLTIENILKTEELKKSLIQIIEMQTKKSIKSIITLFSYDKNLDRGCSFKQQFHKLMDNKSSLLFIARSQTQDKIFGAFTQEKYCSDPEDYWIKQFHGNSFLFSLIDQKFQHFNFIDGQNSIIYDSNYLVFGNEDLMLDLYKNRCVSRFASGKQSLTFKITSESEAKGLHANNNTSMNNRLISDQGKYQCNVLQYSVFEVQFR